MRPNIVFWYLEMISLFLSFFIYFSLLCYLMLLLFFKKIYLIRFIYFLLLFFFRENCFYFFMFPDVPECSVFLVLSTPLIYRGGSRGGPRGAQLPPPLILRPNWGPKGWKHFWETGPPLISGSGWPQHPPRPPPPHTHTPPALVWRSGSATDLYRFNLILAPVNNF